MCELTDDFLECLSRHQLGCLLAQLVTAQDQPNAQRVRERLKQLGRSSLVHLNDAQFQELVDQYHKDVFSDGSPLPEDGSGIHESDHRVVTQSLAHVAPDLYNRAVRAELKVVYDSRPATWEHIHTVRQLISVCVQDLMNRMLEHDQTKLRPPEVEYFDKYTPCLAGTTYGSEEYHNNLKAMKPAIDHHNEHNRHHPEYHNKGVQDMNLLDLLEMLMDWKAATLRHNDGNIMDSITKNQKRFGYGDELAQIFRNTIAYLECT